MRHVLTVSLALIIACAGALAQGNLPPPVQAAIDDLAAHLNIPAEQITVVHLEGVTWPDTSLGCPKPGEFYAQVLVHGYKVILEAAGHRYEYHTDMTGRVIRVTDQAATGADTADRPDVVGMAIADLAERLGVEPDGVELVSWKEQTWMDGSLGLPEPGMVYTKAIVSGYFVVLGANHRQYAYHCSDNAALLAGVHIPDDAIPTLLCLRRTEPLDGNNFFELVRMDPTVGGESEVVFPFLSDFAATPDGKSLAAMVRTSRSSHELVIPRGDDEPLGVDRGFSFGAMAWSPLGHKLAYWKRESLLEGAYSLQVYDAIAGTRETITPAGGAAWGDGGMAWTLDGLAFTVIAAGQGPCVMFWDGTQVRQVASGSQVLGWIPHTSCVFVRRLAGEDKVTLASLRLRGDGEVLELLQARDVLSAADVPGMLAALCVTKGEGGRLKLVQASWGGTVKELRPVPGRDAAQVAVGPKGWLTTLRYVGPDHTVVEVLRLGEELTSIMKLEDYGTVEPIVR